MYEHVSIDDSLDGIRLYLRRMAQELQEIEGQVEWLERPCMPWYGSKTKGGHGICTVRGKHMNADRAAWEYFNGPLPEGSVLCHHCDDRSCFEITHLFAGDPQQNADEVAKRGRPSAAIQPGLDLGALFPDATARTREMLEHLVAGRSQASISAQYGVSRQRVNALAKRLQIGPKLPIDKGSDL